MTDGRTNGQGFSRSRNEKKIGNSLWSKRKQAVANKWIGDGLGWMGISVRGVSMKTALRC